MCKGNTEGPIQARVMGLLASLFFSVPTTIIVWIAINKEIAFWVSSKEILGSNLFLTVLAIFVVVALVFPKLFPSMLGKMWLGLIKYEKWFG